MADFFAPYADRRLAEAAAGLEEARGGRSIFSGGQSDPSSLDAETVSAFENAGVKYGVPVDVLMGIAEKDSGFNSFSRSRGPGQKVRGIINTSDEDMVRNRINPYLPEQAIDTAAKKIRSYLDAGMSIEDAIKAHAGGGDPAKWNQGVNDYSADVMSRTKRLADTYFPEQPAPPAAKASLPLDPTPAGDGVIETNRKPTAEEAGKMFNIAPRARLDASEEAGNALARGNYRFGNMAAVGLPMLVGDYLGLDTSDIAKRYQANERYAQSEYPTDVGSYKDIRTGDGAGSFLGDVGKYAVTGLLENIPQLATSFGMGGIGMKAMERAATAGVESFVEKKMAEGLTQAAAERAAAEMVKRQALKGALGGAYASSAGQETVDINADIREKTGQAHPWVATAAGALAGALDAVEPYQVLKNGAKQQVVDGVLKYIAQRVGKEGLKGFGTEAGTEALQTAIERGAVSFVDGRPFLNRELLDEMIDSGLKGGFAGGGMSAAGQVGSEIGGAIDRRRIEQERENLPRDASGTAMPRSPGSRSASAMEDLAAQAREAGPLPGSQSAQAMRALQEQEGVGPGPATERAMQRATAAGMGAPSDRTAEAMQAAQAGAGPSSRTEEAMRRLDQPGAASADAMARLKAKEDYETAAGMVRPVEQGAATSSRARPPAAEAITPVDSAMPGQGPLSRVLETAAPHVAPLTNAAGQRVILSDENGSLPGTVIGQDAEGILFKDDTGYEQLIENDLIAKGKVTIAPEGQSPAPVVSNEAPVGDTQAPLPVTGDTQPAAQTAPKPAPAPAAQSQLAEQAAAAVTPAPAPAERPLSEMSEEELRAKLKYIADQGKANGWNALLTKKRNEVEKAINAITAKNKEASKPAEPTAPNVDVSYDPVNKRIKLGAYTLNPSKDAIAFIPPGGTKESVNFYDREQRKHYGRRGEAYIDEASAHGVPELLQPYMQGYLKGKLAPEDIVADLKRRLTPTSTEQKIETTKTAEPSPVAKNPSPEPLPDEPATSPKPADEAKIKRLLNDYSMSPKAMQAKLDNYSLNETHEVYDKGNGRWGVRAKADEGSANAPQAPAPSAAQETAEAPKSTYGKSKKAPPEQRQFNTVSKSGPVSATKNQFEPGYNVSWASTHIANAETMDEAARIAEVVANSGADNIADMRKAAAEASKPAQITEAPAPIASAAASQVKETPVPVTNEPDNANETTAPAAGKPKRDAKRRDAKKAKAKTPVAPAKPAPQQKLIGENRRGNKVYEDEDGVRSYVESGIQVSEPVMIVPGGGASFDSSRRGSDFKTREEIAPPAAESAAPAPAVSENTIFTKDEYEAARARFKARNKGTQFNSGINPEDMVDGIKMAGYHIEKGARTFAAFAEAMLADLGENIRPYLKSWYLGVKFDPRSANFDGMDGAGAVEAFDLASLNGERNEPAKLDQPSAGTLEGVSANPVQGTATEREAGERAEGSGRADVSGARPARGKRDGSAGSVGDGQGTLSLPAGGAGTERLNEPASGKRAQDTAADFAISEDDRIGEGGKKTKYKQNIEAIRIVKRLAETGASPSAADQKALAKYVGWGGIPEAFERSDGSLSKGWEKEATELKELLTADEYAEAAASTQYAHYTAPEVVSAMWDGMRRMGFTGGRVLEPGMGVGNFFGLMPKDLRTTSALHGVEKDIITGGVAKGLYPAAKIAAPMDFRDYTIPEGYFDAAIGNPPFASTKIKDTVNRDISGFSLHNYFFAKALNGLKPGGVMSMVVTSRMLDSISDTSRQYMAERADLVAAIRLPNNAFLKNAGTQVTTDIIILRKREPMQTELEQRLGKKAGETWAKVGQYTNEKGQTVPLNEYFIRHPENMLGEFGPFGSMYSPDEPALVAREGQDTATLLREAMARLPENITTGSAVEVKEESPISADSIEHVRVGSAFLRDGKVMLREPDRLGEPQASEATFASEKAKERVVGMVGVRDAFAKLRALQLNAKATDKQIEAGRAALNDVYDKFVRKNGYINEEANKRLFRDDPSWPQISALEDDFSKGITPAVAKTTGQSPAKPSAKKAAIFSKRTQSPYAPPTKATTAKDALLAALSERGHVDLDLMQKLYGKDQDAILKELGDLVFNDPIRGPVTREEYLSGNVKAKLGQAIEAAQKDPAMQRNVDALREVQPADVEAIDIDVKIGSHWIPIGVMREFASHILGDAGKLKVIYNPATAGWTVSGEPSADAAIRWGTNRARPAEIIEAAANQRAIMIRDKQSDGSYVLNEVDTQAANDKVQAVKDEWRRWIFDEDSRRETLAGLYNEMFNTNVRRSFDGSHLTFPGKVGDDVVRLRPHQANAVWRALQSSTTLFDHVVGAGKTFTMVAAAMEMRRMGLAKKPMFVVPNHLVGQWAADFVKLYPNAQILAATKKDFEKENRKKLFARIATGDWDAVIVAHSSFAKVEVDPVSQNAFIEKQVADLLKTEEAMREADGKDSRNVKQVQNRIEKLREKQKRLLDTGAKDDSLYWKELGVDALFLDEAHEFKNLEFSSSMQRVAGLGNQSGSQKASDLYLKVNQVLEATGGRNIVFATGTPISNTMAEMFTMQRYLDGKALEEQGLSHFDAWARLYGDVVTDWELSPSGTYKMNSRFAKFVNMPELMQRYTSFADVINRDDINAQLAARGEKLPVPKIKGGKPQNIVVERSPDQASFMESLVKRSENLPKKVTKGSDNMLKIMSDARKSALDMRLIDQAYPDYAESKVNNAANRIVDLYKIWDADKGTQLVFIDLSTPKGAVAKEQAALRELISQAEAGDEAAQEKLDAMSPDELLALDAKFSVYDDLKQKLIDRGIPENEIVFIHDATTEQKKEELFGKVKSGRVRVLFGSTAKMGAGMNVQERLVALHHLDAPWRPSDLEQREGRIIRQGNVLRDRDPDNFEVEINRYAAKATLDSRMWQTIEGKARFIEQVRKGTEGSREIEDVAGEAANAAEMKAAASGNPLILEEMTLRQRVKKLENEERAHRQEQWSIKDRIKQNEQSIKASETSLADMREDAKTEIPEEFAMSIRGETFDKRKEAGAKIIEEAFNMRDAGGRAAAIGNYGGFKITLNYRPDALVFHLTLKGKGEYTSSSFPSSADAQGVAQRIVMLARETRDIAGVENGIAERKATVEKLASQIKDWPKTAELAEAKQRHSDIIAELKPKQKPAEAPIEETPKASIGRSAGMSPDSLRDTLTRGQDGPIIKAMLDSGKVVIEMTGKGMPAGAQAATMPDGTIRLVASNLDASTARGVLLHEVFHSGGEALVGQDNWKSLLRRVQTAANNAKPGSWVAQAKARAEAANTPDQHMAEEIAAYAIEDAENAPAGIREIADRMVGVVKAFLLRRFGKQFGTVTPGQLRSLAIAALRSRINAPRSMKMFSVELAKEQIKKIINAAQMSGHAPETAKFGPVENWLVDYAAKNGMNINGFSHAIDGSAVRHIINRHSNEKIEISRGQIPIKPEDFEKIPEIIADPDQIVFGTKSNVGRDQIAFIKKMSDGTTLYLEEVRVGRETLSAHSMRKYPAAKDFTSIAASLPSNARSDGGTKLKIIDNPARDKTRYSIASNIRAAASNKDKSVFQRATDAASDFLTQAMVGGGSRPGQFSSLALTPVRALFTELSKGMPAASQYIDTKQAMDAFRNEMNTVDDALLQDWLKWGRKNKAANSSLMDVMHESTLAQYDPSLTDKEALSKGQAVDPTIKAKHDALPKEAKDYYAKIRDAYAARAKQVEDQVIANVQKALEMIVKNAKRAYDKEMERIRDEGLEGEEKLAAEKAAREKLTMAQTRQARNKAARIKRMRQYFESNRIKGPYFPLARFGNYFVTLRDADGKVLSFEKYASRFEQRARAEELRKDFGNDAVKESTAQYDAKEARSVDPGFLASIDTILDEADVDVAVRDAVYQTYLETMPDLSMRKARIHRKGTAGFEQDAVRGFAHNMFHSAHQLSRLRYGMDLQDHLAEASKQARGAEDPIRAQAVYNEMAKSHEFTMNPEGSPLAHYVTSGVFLWTMAFNLSTAMVNTLQSVNVGIPNIAFDVDTSGKAGLRRAGKAMAQSAVDFVRGKGTVLDSSKLTNDEQAAVRAAYNSGLIDSTQAHDLAGVAESGIYYRPGVQRFMRAASMPMHQTERFNREITFLAAYRVSREAGLDHVAAIKKAEAQTWATHFDNQSNAKPRFARGQLGKMLFALKSYQANFVYRIFRDLHQALQGKTETERKTAIKRFASMFMLTSAAAGVRGAFFYSTVMAIAGAFMGLMGKDDDDPDEILRKAVIEAMPDNMIGHAVAGTIMDGIPGYFTGTSLTNRVGMQDMWFHTNDRDLNADQQWAEWATQLLGAGAGLANQGFKGLKDIADGNVERGIEKMLPASVRNVAKAARYATEGVQDKYGNPIVENVPWQDVLKQTLGFTPAVIADRFARNTFENNMQERIQKKATDARKAVARAMMAGDDKAETKAREAVDSYNERYPEYQVKPKSIMQSMRTMQRRSDRMEFGVDINPKLRERIEGRVSPSIYSR